MADALAQDELWLHAPCGLLLTATDGGILRANARLCSWLGYTPDDLVGRMRLQDLFTVGSRVFHQTHLAPLLLVQGAVSEIKVELRRREGQAVPMLLDAHRRERDGVMQHEVALMVVNERHHYERELVHARRSAEAALGARLQAEEQLRRANERLSAADRRKDEFLATLAHELRNPLGPMRNGVELLKRPGLSRERQAWSRDLLERQLQHLTHLVDDLLEVSRITQDKLDLRMAPVELPRVLDDAIDAARSLMQSAGHRFEVDLPQQPIAVQADATRLTQIALNLLSNAAKYTPSGGWVQLRVVREGGEALIAVRDSGIGIAPEHIDGLFEMFSQVSPARERAQGGLGIGLALVRRLTELHGGRVEAHSAGDGKGSEFVVRLPVLEAGTDAAPATTASASDAAAPRRVLVVDDNPDAAESLALLLTLQGHAAQTASDGAEALALAEGFAPQLMLLDIGLPGMNGYEVARRVRAAEWGRSVYLVALTGWGQDRDKADASAAGFDRHLTKPLDPDELEALLRAAPAG